MPTLDVLDSTIAYDDLGDGTPFVFLHGNPGWSYGWRHVLAHLGAPGRMLAPDLIGMGRSGKPDIAYTFADHAAHLDVWFDALELDGVVLVGHDWGGALAFDWAARHPGRVRGVAFFETIVRPLSWRDLDPSTRPRYEALRAPGTGEQKVLEENFYMETALHRTALRPWVDDDLAAYRAPYPTPASRRPLLAWARSMPIEGEPADVVARVEAYDRWLAQSADVPKLLLTFEGAAASLMIGPELAAWCAEHIAALEIEACGPAAHLALEDQPAAIAAAVARRADRHELRAVVQDEANAS
jgi:haloalkane dehalogenase